MSTNIHIPVLSDLVMEHLELQPDSVVVDATLGGAGHASRIAAELSSEGRLIGIDVDPLALTLGREALASAACRIDLVQGNFRNIASILDTLNVSTITHMLMDLGWSSNQIENPERGFSFMADGPLDMRLDPDADISAWNVINEWGEETLADIMYGFADERFSRRIAKAIIEARTAEPISSTLQLADIIANAIPKRFHPKRVHPATKAFQAIRMAVNDELGALEQGIKDGFDRLIPGGRLAVITFHSTEDRAVKHYFRSLHDADQGQLVTKKPLIAGDQELQDNPRARSAKLRIIEKL